MSKHHYFRPATAALLIFAGAALAACGGGGDDNAPPPTQPPGDGSAPTWTENVFAEASTFKDKCADPRSGSDVEGTPFPDEEGSLLEELFWLRSWTHETYLWNDEVVDRDPSAFSDRVEYFDTLKTTAIEPSGEDRDDFHFIEPTADFLDRRNSNGSPGYGIEYVIAQAAPPRDIRVAYNLPNSPASTVVSGTLPMPRGTKILEINGSDIVNGYRTEADLDALSELLFPSQNGLSREFLVEYPNGARRTVTLVTENVEDKAVLKTVTFTDPSGTVGYIAFNTFGTFSAQEEIVQAMQILEAEGVDDLVLDLRYNSGGLLVVASQTAYMIAGASQTAGADFERLIFNDDAGNTDPTDGSQNDPFPFIDEVLNFGTDLTVDDIEFGDPLPTLDLDRVFILSTEDTCSASESVINGLRGIDVEVILIGDTTCGKPYGFTPQDNCGLTYYTIQFKGENNKGFSDYADGFIPGNSSAVFGARIPGCVVADDLNSALGNPSEALFAAALEYRNTGTCPSVATTSVSTTYIANKSGPRGLVLERPTSDLLARSGRDVWRPE